MKTSLIIEDSLYHQAKSFALKTGMTISEVISSWARVGMERSRERKKVDLGSLKAVDLGEPLIGELHSRRDWIDLLDK